jgi:hypothetical protein
MVRLTGCTVNFFEENESNLATITRRPVHEMGFRLHLVKKFIQ